MKRRSSPSSPRSAVLGTRFWDRRSGRCRGPPRPPRRHGLRAVSHQVGEESLLVGHDRPVGNREDQVLASRAVARPGLRACPLPPAGADGRRTTPGRGRCATRGTRRRRRCRRRRRPGLPGRERLAPHRGRAVPPRPASLDVDLVHERQRRQPRWSAARGDNWSSSPRPDVASHRREAPVIRGTPLGDGGLVFAEKKTGADLVPPSTRSIAQADPRVARAARRLASAREKRRTAFYFSQPPPLEPSRARRAPWTVEDRWAVHGPRRRSGRWRG